MGMSGGARRAAGAAALLVALLAVAAWWFDARTKPDRVGPRFVAGLVARHPGTMAEPLDGGVLRAALPSGVGVDVRLSTLFDRCAASRLDCSTTIDHAIDDVDRAEAASRAPDRSMLRPIVVGDGAGFRFGYLTEPLVGSFEIRYALVSGVASTFVTATIADRLGLSRGDLGPAAMAGWRTERTELERVAEIDTPVFRVRSGGDPAAALIDPDRMARFATVIGSRRLYAIVPTRDALALAAADEPAARALDALQIRLRGKDARTLDGGLFAYDADAPDGQRLTIAKRSPALRLP